MHSTTPFLTDPVFEHYYHCYECTEFLEIHHIFNAVVAFPVELTQEVTLRLIDANLSARMEALAVVEKRFRIFEELMAVRECVTGVYRNGREPEKLPLPLRLLWSLDAATWLDAFAYEGLPYVFDLGTDITGLVLQNPRLRAMLTEVGVTALRRLRENGPACTGRPAYSEFWRVVKAYVRVLTSELFRRYGQKLLDDIEPFYEIYLH